LVFPAHDANRLAHANRGVEQPANDRLGQNVGYADDQAHRSIARPAPQRVQQFPAEREHFVGVAERYASDGGEDKGPPSAGEEPFAENILEPVDLSADSLRGQPELGARASDRAFPRDRPEVKEVVVVQPFHGAQDNSKKSENRYQTI